MMAYLTLILMAPSFNSFAYEGRGMQTYFMLPVRFRDIFIAKNLVTGGNSDWRGCLLCRPLKWRVDCRQIPFFSQPFAR